MDTGVYRILIATKRGDFEYENTYKWYSQKDENDFMHVIYFSTLEEAQDKVKELLTDPRHDYSFHDLVIVKHENYAIKIESGEDILSV